MNLTFYKNLSDPKCAVKNLQSLGVIQNVTLRSEESILTPSFEVATAALPNDFNYVYCDYTGRFYFTGNAIMVRNGLYRIPCHVDVLSTYNAPLRALSATINRNEAEYNGYIIDDNYIGLAYEEVVSKPFPNAMENDSIVLITVG